jgi:hypothetical protein
MYKEAYIAHVVIIEADEKIRREMKTFLSEMDIVDVDEFSTSTEFEIKYFQSLINPKTIPKADIDPLVGLSPDEVKFVTQANISTERPFIGEAIFEINTENFQLVKVDSAKVFEYLVTDMLKQSFKIDKLVPTVLHATLNKFLTEAKTTNKSQAKMVFANAKAQIWLTEINAELKNNSILISVKDLTTELLVKLGKVAKKEEVKEEKEKLQAIDLIFFRPACIIDPDFKKWVTKASALLKRVELWPDGFRPKFIATRYDQEQVEKSNYHHAFIDDLLCYPLDRMIFLQKTEIALKLPDKVSPSFLFVQETQDTIEMSKKVVIERINDYFCAISNPMPLAIGTGGKFYFKLPGQKNWLSVYGQCARCSPHPEVEGQHLIFFQYFGLSKDVIRELRQYFNRDPYFKPHLENNADNFKFNPDNIFLTESQKRKRTIAILDYDEATAKSLNENIRNEIGNVDIVSDDTYYGFFRKYLDVNNKQVKTPPATKEDFYSESISLLIDYGSLNLQMSLTPANEEDKVFGHEAAKMFAEPQGWIKLFDNIDTKNLLMDCLHLVQTAKRMQKNMDISNAAGELKNATVEIITEDNGNNIRINIKPLDFKLLTRTQLERIESLDALIIDTSLIKGEMDSFVTGLNKAAKDSGLIIPEGGVPIILLCEDLAKFDMFKLQAAKILTVISKPLEMRRLLVALTLAIDTPFSINNFENLRFKEEKLNSKLAKPSHIIEISEFGATLKNESTIKPGTLLYLHQSIFSNAPDQNLCVRVYHSQENEEGESFAVSVVYFGITDAFLKFTRAFIRDTYAQKKAKEATGGGAS